MATLEKAPPIRAGRVGTTETIIDLGIAGPRSSRQPVQVSILSPGSHPKRSMRLAPPVLNRGGDAARAVHALMCQGNCTRTTQACPKVTLGDSIKNIGEKRCTLESLLARALEFRRRADEVEDHSLKELFLNLADGYLEAAENVRTQEDAQQEGHSQPPIE